LFAIYHSAYKDYIAFIIDFFIVNFARIFDHHTTIEFNFKQKMFNSLNLIISVDATFTDGLGRMVNKDQPKKSNCVMKKIKGETKVYLVLCAIRDIEKR